MAKRIVIAVVAATVAAGCGSASKHSGTGSPSPGSAATGSTTATSPESVREIIADAIAAAKTVHSYRAQGSFTDAQGSASVLAEVNSPTQLRMVEKRSSGEFEAVIYARNAYFKASRAYWTSQPNVTPAQAAVLADRWLRLPSAEGAQLAATVASQVDLGKHARCWSGRESDFTVTGSGTVDGKPVVILRSAGAAPGTAPGTTYVSTTDPKIPLKTVTTGPVKPGGLPGCASDHTSSTVTLSGVNQHFQIARPPSAITLR